MKNVIQNLEGVVEQIGDLADTKVAIWKLKTAHTVNNYLSHIIGVFLLIFLSLIAALFLGFGLAFYLGQLLNSTGLGFLIAGGVFAIVGLFFFLLRRKLFPRLLHHSLLKMVFKEDADKYKSPEAALTQMLAAEKTQKESIKQHLSETVKDISYMFVFARILKSAGKVVGSLFGNKSSARKGQESGIGSDAKKIIGNTLWTSAVEIIINMLFSKNKKAEASAEPQT